MFIKVTIEARGIQHDIKIYTAQKIGAGLQVLRQSGKLPYGESPDYFRSLLERRPVSAYKTFAEESVHDGDILSAIL